MSGTVRPCTVRQCAILVGGLGTRLGALTQTVPKPLMRCGDRPFLAWLMREMQRFGVEEFVLLAGHLSAEIEAAVDEIRRFLPRPATITISVEPSRAGTGGALHHARALLDERFLLCNGDSVFSCNLADLLRAAQHDPGCWLLLRPVADLDRYGAVALGPDGRRVQSFQARAASQAGTRSGGLINSGVYLLDSRIFDYLTPDCSLEQDVLPALAEAGQLSAVVKDGYFRDIGLPGDLAAAAEELPRVLRRDAVLLDRDGVINRDDGWVGTRDRFVWLPGVREAIRALVEAGRHVFMVTNQSGVARGLYTEADLHALTAWMTEEIRMAGGTLDDWRYCPYHPEAALEGYRRTSDWRKPGPGMILDLMKAWELDPVRCLLIGDQPCDIAAARAAGIEGRLVGPDGLDKALGGTR